MIGLVHYHLRIGGVRRVMEAQAECLRAAKRDFRFIVGEEPIGDFDFPYQVVDGLGYAGDCPDLKAAAPDVDLWHCHNPTLGKNPSLTLRIYELALSGERLLMQLHDFAEDNRPENFAGLTDVPLLYPLAAHIHYAFINSRDCEILRRCGLPREHSTLLGNEVKAPNVTKRQPDKTPLIFYPVRGIRRKNLGEAVLLAAAAKKAGIEAEFAIALTADSPVQREIHDQWRAFAKHLELPIQFNVVNTSGQDFIDWMSRCTHVMTTSVAEGFGMSFLEPGLLGIPIIGRDIPEITVDFGDGLDGCFYQAIEFDLTTDWRASISERLQDSLTAHFAAYGRDTRLPDVPDSWDFGNLPEELQEAVIVDYLNDEIELQIQQQELVNWLPDALQRRANSETPRRIASRFGQAAYQAKLFEIYDALLSSSPTPENISFVDVESVLDCFLSPRRFNFLRSQS